MSEDDQQILFLQQKMFSYNEKINNIFNKLIHS